MKSRFLDNKQANKNEEERLEHGIFITLSDDIHIQLFTDLFYVIKKQTSTTTYDKPSQEK